jgi:hypothetical protein
MSAAIFDWLIVLTAMPPSCSDDFYSSRSDFMPSSVEFDIVQEYRMSPSSKDAYSDSCSEGDDFSS